MKKKEEGKLIGRFVLVHPFLTTDPVKKQGEIGKIIAAFPSKEVLCVKFDDGQQAFYLSDAVLTLNHKDVLTHRSYLNKRNDPLNELVVKEVINLLTLGKQKDALELIKFNTTLQDMCLINCADWLDLKKENRRKPERQKRNPL